MSSTTPKKKQRIQVFDTGDDAKQEEMINPYTNEPYSRTYLNILETRRKLPVWKQKSDFLHQLAASQTLVLVGETGSGKTTQMAQILLRASVSRTCVAVTQPRRVAAGAAQVGATVLVARFGAVRRFCVAANLHLAHLQAGAENGNTASSYAATKK